MCGHSTEIARQIEDCVHVAPFSRCGEQQRTGCVDAQAKTNVCLISSPPDTWTRSRRATKRGNETRVVISRTAVVGCLMARANKTRASVRKRGAQQCHNSRRGAPLWAATAATAATAVSGQTPGGQRERSRRGESDAGDHSAPAARGSDRAGEKHAALIWRREKRISTGTELGRGGGAVFEGH